ncbi:MAG: winged helix-turn-helix transcriptional regulator [Candidatus Woesearchaeota archaeon]|nr:MAG: winged helix-turn-helix transcriptional regulator [Candidatus Woesearchaeota archaeon]
MNCCHKFFGTLGSKLKADIIHELKDKELSVTELANILQEERSKVSHALLILKTCSFVIPKKEGRKQIYSINKETILPLLHLAETHIKKYCKRCITR